MNGIVPWHCLLTAVAVRVSVTDTELIQMGGSGEANEGSVYRGVMRVTKTNTVVSRHHPWA